MKRVFLILLVAIMMMAVFVSVALAGVPDPEYPAALDAEDTSAEVVSAVDEPPDAWIINPAASAMIPALYIIGLIIKKTPKIPDWIIPIILLALGIVGGGVIVGWTASGIIQGALAAGLTVYGNQLYKQIGNGITGGS